MSVSTVDDEHKRCVSWVHEVWIEDVVAFRAGKRGSRLVAEWPGLASLECARDGSGARITRSPGAPPLSVEKLRHGQIRALMHDLRGGLALHASAVAIGQRAVIFVGESGAGKSTAAAEMCLRHGAELLADDAVSLDVSPRAVAVLPCEADHWLTSESRIALGISPPQRKSGDGEANGEKSGLAASRVASKSFPLALVLALSFQRELSTPTLRPLRGADAALLLLRSAFRFDVEDASARRREFEQVKTIYNKAPVLSIARDELRPGDLADVVFEALK